MNSTLLLIIIAVLVIRTRSHPQTWTTTTMEPFDTTEFHTATPYTAWHAPLNFINWSNLTSWVIRSIDDNETTTTSSFEGDVTTTEEPSSFDLFKTLDSTRQNFMFFLAKGLSEAHKQEQAAKKFYQQELDKIRRSQDVLKLEAERRLNFTRSYFRSYNLAVLPSVF